jgi:hypothetical protein
MTLWRPDTCACAIEYDETITTCLAVHGQCGKHAGVSQANILATLLAHNRQKNAVLNYITANAVSLNLPTQGGAPAVSVYYDPNAPAGNDPLNVVAPGMSALNVTALQNNLTAKFGAGVATAAAVAPPPLPTV